MGNIFRKTVLALLGISFMPAIAEFFVKLAEQKGIYDDPEGYLMIALQTVIGSTWYIPTVFFYLGYLLVLLPIIF